MHRADQMSQEHRPVLVAQVAHRLRKQRPWSARCGKRQSKLGELAFRPWVALQRMFKIKTVVYALALFQVQGLSGNTKRHATNKMLKKWYFSKWLGAPQWFIFHKRCFTGRPAKKQRKERIKGYWTWHLRSVNPAYRAYPLSIIQMAKQVFTVSVSPLLYIGFIHYGIWKRQNNPPLHIGLNRGKSSGRLPRPDPEPLLWLKTPSFQLLGIKVYIQHPPTGAFWWFFNVILKSLQKAIFGGSRYRGFSFRMF